MATAPYHRHSFQWGDEETDPYVSKFHEDLFLHAVCERLDSAGDRFCEFMRANDTQLLADMPGGGANAVMESIRQKISCSAQSLVDP